jgi:2-polyprenyl-3-methyl-5-hydroxy-6-metoxy-1,4-benzoquinol methylase
MRGSKYQYGFSERYSGAMYDEARRTQKGNKMLAIVGEVCGALASKSLLDIGCSTGIMSRLYGESFGRVIGIDIDAPAVDHARQTNASSHVAFLVKSADDTGFDSESFDVVSCTHIYEHVPDAGKMMSEIHRLLRPGGICYFTAGNRLHLIEPHYRLPLLSVIPKPLAHIYLRLLGKGDRYYENHLSLWGLKKLVSRFEVTDYTRKIIQDPVKYFATEMIAPNSLKQKLVLRVLNTAYFLSPTYVWILRKESASS